MVNAVDRLDALQNVLNGVVHRVLACFDCQPLVPHVLQRYYFRAYLVLRELLARNRLVLRVIRTVQAPVDAVVREVQRRKQHYPVSVEGLLDLLSYSIDARNNLRVLAGQEHRRFTVSQPRACAPLLVELWAGLVQKLVDECLIVLVGLSVYQRVQYLLMVDEIVSMRR